MESEKRTYRMEVPTGSVAYFHYDVERNEVVYDGHAHPMPEGKFIDFLHVAGMVGLKVGKI